MNEIFGINNEYEEQRKGTFINNFNDKINKDQIKDQRSFNEYIKTNLPNDIEFTFEDLKGPLQLYFSKQDPAITDFSSDSNFKKAPVKTILKGL